MNDNNSLAHSTWNCKYHIVFAPNLTGMQILEDNMDEIWKKWKSNFIIDEW